MALQKRFSQNRPVRRVAAWLSLLLLAGLTPFAPAATIVEPVPELNDPIAGASLAVEVRTLKPAEPIAARGILRTKKSGQPATEAKFNFLSKPAGVEWQAVYEIAPSNAPPLCFAIIHRASGTNLYAQYSGGVSNLDSATLKPIPAGTPLLFSDFTVGELALEFLHWPSQVLLRRELKRSRSCDVLESKNPLGDGPAGYSRVVSWVDRETRGILQAEAFDHAGKLTKEFSVGSFKKIKGKYQLEEMEIQSPPTKSRTWLKFDLEAAPD